MYESNIDRLKNDNSRNFVNETFFGQNNMLPFNIVSYEEITKHWNDVIKSLNNHFRRYTISTFHSTM